MTTLGTLVEAQDEPFQANARNDRALAADLRAKATSSALGGYETSRQLHVSCGKLLSRDRVHCLLDPGSRLLGDGIMDPARARDVPGQAFAARLNAPIPDRARFGIFRM